MPYDYDKKEYTTTLNFDCDNCPAYNEDYMVTYHKGDDDAYVYCQTCGAENEVSLGGK